MKERSSPTLVEAKVRMLGLLLSKKNRTDEEKEMVFQLFFDDDIDAALRRQSGRPG